MVDLEQLRKDLESRGEDAVRRTLTQFSVEKQGFITIWLQEKADARIARGYRAP